MGAHCACHPLPMCGTRTYGVSMTTRETFAVYSAIALPCAGLLWATTGPIVALIMVVVGMALAVAEVTK